MVTREQVLSVVGRFKDESRTLVNLQSTNDIIRALIECHKDQAYEYDKICLFFEKETAYDTGECIWLFLKKNVRYKIEPDEYQTIRTPGAIVATGKRYGADCKNYSLFTAGIIDALNRRGAGIPWCFRFASYDPTDTTPYHVFVVLYPRSGQEIWIDAVLDTYDYHKEPCYYKDQKVMLARVSGIKNGSVGRVSRNIGQGDGDDIDDIGFDPSTVTSDINPNTPVSSDDSSDTSFNTSALPDQQVSNGGDLSTSSQDFNPSTVTNNLTTAETESEVNTLSNSTGSSGSTNVLSNLFNSLFGSSSSGSSGGLSTGAGTSSTAGKSSGSSSGGETININTGSTATTNYLPWIIGGAAVLLLVVVLSNDKKR